MSGQEPGTNETTHQRDWEAQRERLSAFVDDQLPADERAALERHLPTCARCTAELAALRRTVALLRALPAPALPRSFALPATTELAATASVRDSEPATDGIDRERTGAAPTPLPVRRPTPAYGGARPPRWAGIAQWAGGLAAVAGLVLLLSGALSGLPLGRYASAGMTASGATNLAPHAETPGHTLAPTASAYGTEGAANQSTTPAPGATAPVTPTTIGAPERTPQASYGPYNSASTASPLPILPLTGGGLVLGGGLVFIAGSVVRRRRAA